jgi:hypothetical protein
VKVRLAPRDGRDTQGTATAQRSAACKHTHTPTCLGRCSCRLLHGLQAARLHRCLQAGQHAPPRLHLTQQLPRSRALDYRLQQHSSRNALCPCCAASVGQPCPVNAPGSHVSACCRLGLLLQHVALCGLSSTTSGSRCCLRLGVKRTHARSVVSTGLCPALSAAGPLHQSSCSPAAEAPAAAPHAAVAEPARLPPLRRGLRQVLRPRPLLACSA